MGRSGSGCCLSRQLASVGAVVVIGLQLLLTSSPALVYGSCIPAIYNFGDSTSDTGNLAATFPGFTQGEHAPYGETYFGRPVGRYSDGRLLIDFIGTLLPLHASFFSQSLSTFLLCLLFAWVELLSLSSEHLCQFFAVI